MVLAGIYYIVGIFSCMVGLVVMACKIARSYHMWKMDTDEIVKRALNLLNDDCSLAPKHKKFMRNLVTFFISGRGLENGRIRSMYKVLDLFCGAGGLSFGFEKSKEFNIVLGIIKTKFGLILNG